MGMELIIGGLIAGAGAVMQYQGAQDAKEAAGRQATSMENSAAESRKQFAAQQRIADIKNARERANMARQARIARASTVSTGALTGTSGSSGVLGGVASIGTQASSNQGYFSAVGANQDDILTSQSAQAGFGAEAGRAGADVTSAQANIGLGQNIFNLGTNVFNAGGGFKSIFDSTKTKMPPAPGVR